MITGISNREPFLIHAGLISIHRDPVMFPEKVGKIRINKIIISFSNNILLFRPKKVFKRGVTAEIYPIRILEPDKIRNGLYENSLLRL
ncbi:MAG: hypothetical protein BWY45_03385 [Euryarchaeota archaeon ADurb.Bin294]|nr:MAG: hypothetical protein BWY45_03385 [Euryarchaeota archaeon ADurb.Bin294]